MKRILLFLLGAIAAIVFLANLGPMILLAISLGVSYFAIRKFILANGLAEKVLWGVVILIGLAISLNNIPALIGIASFAVLYYTFKKWKQEKKSRYMDDEWPVTD